MKVGVLVGSLLGRVLPMKQNVDSLSEEEIVHGKDTIVAKKGRKESRGRTQPKGKRLSKEARDESQSSSKVRRQPKKSKLPSKDGELERTRVQGRQAHKTASKSKSVGSKQQG